MAKEKTKKKKRKKTVKKIEKVIEKETTLDEDVAPEGPGDFTNVKVNTSSRLRANKTFFFEKPNGKIFACEEQEAANAKYMSKLRFVGWSDGTTYIKTIRAANLKPGQVIPKEKAEELLRSAFDAELKRAKQNLAKAKKSGTSIPRPRRIEWSFDGSVPLDERNNITRGQRYGNATRNK